VPEIVELVEADLLDGQRTDVVAVTDAIARDTSVVLLDVAEDGVLVACCQLDRRDDSTAYFGMFAVRPGRQGGGVGRRVLAHAEEFAREQYAATVVEMTVIGQRSELIAWYERRGYRQTGAARPFPYGDERFGIPRREDLHFVVLAKPLGQAG
jgi:ribosomal protein S18 acetylase RimI-like enzyme